MSQTRGEPFMFSDWRHVVFMHFEVEPEVLQRQVPFDLDLRDGRAFVSLVAFHLENMHLRFGGALTRFLMSPIEGHELLNIRTYVVRNGEPGIYFLSEYLPNPWSVRLGPPLYGLPYRLADLRYDHGKRDKRGVVRQGDHSLEYSGFMQNEELTRAESGTLEEFLLERYTAFTERNGVERFFRIWHEPWPHTTIDIEVTDTSLLEKTGDWFKAAQFIGAHYSPGVESVWMGYPRKLKCKS